MTPIVVFLHWGHELASCPTAVQRSLARKLTAAGADVVVGSHAHVLLGAGRLGQALVAYGLGNFVFYAFREATSQTGVLEVTVTGRRVDGYRWVPARISGGIPHPVTGSAKASALASWRSLRACTGLRPRRAEPTVKHLGERRTPRCSFRRSARGRSARRVSKIAFQTPVLARRPEKVLALRRRGAPGRSRSGRGPSRRRPSANATTNVTAVTRSASRIRGRRVARRGTSRCASVARHGVREGARRRSSAPGIALPNRWARRSRSTVEAGSAASLRRVSRRRRRRSTWPGMAAHVPRCRVQWAGAGGCGSPRAGFRRPPAGRIRASMRRAAVILGVCLALLAADTSGAGRCRSRSSPPRVGSSTTRGTAPLARRDWQHWGQGGTCRRARSRRRSIRRAAPYSSTDRGRRRADAGDRSAGVDSVVVSWWGPGRSRTPAAARR